jgi:F-box interacting protein
MGSVSLPYQAIFDILSRTPVKSECRFRCVSKGWRNLISGPVFAAAHKLRHGPLLVDAGSFPEEEPAGGRDLRLMDMEGNVLRVISGAGGYGMMCNTSLDDLICVTNAFCGGINVVDPATGEVLVTCPRLDVVGHDVFPYVATRYYTVFGFGRAAMSGEYKLVRVIDDYTCEIFTIGDGRGWRKMQPPPVLRLDSERGSPITIDGLMYSLRIHNDDALIIFDLESEQWKANEIEGPRKVAGEAEWNVSGIRLTELNGALCMVQSVCEDMYIGKYNTKKPKDPLTNIWIMDSSDMTWFKAYTIPMASFACRYMPLREIRDGGKLLLHCSFDEGRSLVLQIYDPHTDTCTGITGAPHDLAGRIGLCSFGLDHPVSVNRLLARFLDQALLFFSK